ncbi:MAG: hypothetical protein NC342_01300 [Pseudoflavonifractor sp.]|nr:hypothetical protein [Alloprevotella sp.]MCM1116160.1 hypothetical protein [Pseudoflavonifractor sp.]
MKSIKLLYTLLTALTLAALSSCSNDGPGGVGAYVAHPVELTLSLGVDGSIGSRGGRPLLGEQPWQQVNDMRVYIFRADEGADLSSPLSFTYYRPETPSGETIDYYEVPGFANDTPRGPLQTETLTLNPMLTDGHYRLLAVGLDDKGASSRSMSLDFNEATTWENAIATAANAPAVGEIFTGYPREADGSPATFTVRAATSFNAVITCRRAVAGVLLSVDKIGGDINGKTPARVELRSVGHNEAVDLVGRKPFGNPAGETTIISFPLTPDGDDKTTPDIMGRFILPSSLYATTAEGKSTFTLVVCADDGSELATRAVKIVEAVSGTDGSELDYTADGHVSPDGMRYDIVANRIYRLDIPDLATSLEQADVKIMVIGSWQADIDIEM